MSSTSAPVAKSAPQVPANIRSEFALSWKKRQRRWAKKMNGKVRYFGLTDDPAEAHEHWLDFVRSDVYQTPRLWAEARSAGGGPVTDEPAVAPPANAIKSAPSGGEPSADETDEHDPRAVHPSLKHTPLKLHRRGHHYAWLGGQQITFPADPERALEKYVDVIRRGVGSRPKNGFTIEQVWDRFMEMWEGLEAAGHRRGSRVTHYELVFRLLERTFGATRAWDAITPDEWAAFYQNVILYRMDGTGRRVTPGHVNNRIDCINNVAAWAAGIGFDKGPGAQPPLINEPNFPPVWKTYAPDTVMEERENRKGHFTVDNVRDIISHTAGDAVKRCAVLLGVNCGNGPKENASFVVARHVDVDDAGRWWLTQPRWKTRRPRRILLWPETVDAIKTLQVTREDMAQRFGFDLEGSVRIADITRWEKRSSSRPIYEWFERNDVHVRNRGGGGRVDGHDAARYLVARVRPEPQSGTHDFGGNGDPRDVYKIADLLMLTNRGLPISRLEENQGTGAKSTTSKCRVCSLQQWMDRTLRKLGIKLEDGKTEDGKQIGFYRLRHVFQTNAHQTPGTTTMLVEYQMGHVKGKEIRAYFQHENIDDDRLAQISEHVRSVVIGDGSWME